MGNRRWGEGGFVQGGRRAAKARAMAPPTSGKGKAVPGKGASPPAAQPCSSYAEPAGSGTPHGKAVAREPSEECGGGASGGASGGARGLGKKAYAKAEKAALSDPNP